MSAGDVTVTLKYLQRNPSFRYKPPFVNLSGTSPGEETETNITFHFVGQFIRDIRGSAENFTIDKNGFAIRNFESCLDDVDGTSFTTELVQKQYFEDLERLIKAEVDGADEVIFFDFFLSSEVGGGMELVQGSFASAQNAYVVPSMHPHVDHSPAAAITRVLSKVKPELVPLVLQKSRTRIITVWKPLNGPVDRFALAVCDSSSMADQDLVACRYITESLPHAVLHAQFSPGHEWYYLGQQTPNEALIVKSYDSKDDVEAKRCPRVIFQHPNYQEPPKSGFIEVRALIFTHPST